MANILAVALIIMGALALWLLIGLFIARALGRVASTGEHQHQMDLLHRDARRSPDAAVTTAETADPHARTASPPLR